MAYARIDMNNRILEWSDDHLDGFDTEFDNGDYIHENERNGVQDFIIEQGKAIFSPTDESVAEFEEARKWEKRQAEHSDMMSSLPDILDSTDEALCNLYEQNESLSQIMDEQQSIMDEQDAAICELYEMLS